jgi:hypothetical protein
VDPGVGLKLWNREKSHPTGTRTLDVVTELLSVPGTARTYSVPNADVGLLVVFGFRVSLKRFESQPRVQTGTVSREVPEKQMKEPVRLVTGTLFRLVVSPSV